jgi:SAM-dependent methyltransferase
MVWRRDAPQGSEAAKVRFELVDLFHGRCLDLGCGPEKIFPSKDVIGVDSDKDLGLFGIRAHPDITGECDRLPLFADASVDVVFSSHLLEHIEDFQGALSEWWRVLKPGGRLIVYLPHADWYPNMGMPGSNPDHKHDFRNEDISAAMEGIAQRSGFGWAQERDEVRSEGLEYSFLQVYRKAANASTFRLEPQPKPAKSLGIVRLGAYGDALWITPVLSALKAEGWHITVYTQPQGEASLRHDPNIGRLSTQAKGIFGEAPHVPASVTAELQTRYWLWCERKHDRFINLVGSVERHILPFDQDPNFYLPEEQRRRLFDVNYVERVYEWAGVPFDAAKVRVKFTPSQEEVAWAKEERRKRAGPFVVLNPGGSSLPKYWPHAQRFMDLLAEAGVGGVLLGDTRGCTYEPPKGWEVIGKAWDIRRCYTLAALADVVVGTESAIVNSVAHERPLKIVLLSHSTAKNLTRDWERTIAVMPEGLPCYPCHRIHATWAFCALDPQTGCSACQSALGAEEIAKYAIQWVAGAIKEAA